MLGLLATILFAATGFATYASYQYFLSATTVFHAIQGLLCALIAVVSLSGAGVICGLIELLKQGKDAGALPDARTPVVALDDSSFV